MFFSSFLQSCSRLHLPKLTLPNSVSEVSLLNLSYLLGDECQTLVLSPGVSPFLIQFFFPSVAPKPFPIVKILPGGGLLPDF